MKVLILDDETDRARRWKSALEPLISGEITVFEPGQVSNLISELHSARFESRKGNFNEVSSLEEFDLAIIDYDLLGLEMESPAAWATGAEIAYSMRLMAKIGPIVVVNQYGTNSFDLTMRRSISSYADVDVGSAQVTLPGLWCSGGYQNFRPWFWPDLHKEVSRFSKVCDFVSENLDASVVRTLGLELDDYDAPNFITYEISAFIGAGPRQDVTFRQVVTDNAGLRVFNILEKDKGVIDAMPDSQIARVSSAIIIHWLEKIVLPAHEVFSDVPHLCSQLPWLVDNTKSLESWNEMCSLEVDKVPSELKAYAVHPEFLFSRPVFWAEKVRRELVLPEDFQLSELEGFQFCENLSRFVLEQTSSSFPSDVIAFDKKRWVCFDAGLGASDVNYEPQSYLLM